MTDRSSEINYNWKPNADATGITLFVKIDRPQNLEFGDVKVDAITGTTNAGLFIPEQKVSQETRMNMTGQAEVEVVSIGGCAFAREGLTDMLPGGKNEVLPGTRIWIEEFSAQPLKDEQNRRTLYYTVLEHKVRGKVRGKE